MSTSLDFLLAREKRRLPAAVAALVGVAWCALGAAPSFAQVPTREIPASGEPAELPPLTPVSILMGGMSAYVDALAESGNVWRGQRVPWPEARSRPRAALWARSARAPVAVHAEEGELTPTLALRWLEALEDAFDVLELEGWPLPLPDGGRGGTDGFDVYVVGAPDPAWEDDGLDDEDAASRRPRRSRIVLDAPNEESGRADGVHDAALAHARVVGDVPDDRIASCALQLVASAGLFAMDPAEAEGLREGTAAWLAWATTGQLGCDEDALVRQQRASFRAFLTPDPRDGEGTAIFFGALSARHDGYATQFLRDVWAMSRQKTRDHGDLRGEPDVTRALLQASTLVHDPMNRVVEAMAVSRYFAGDRGGAARPDVPLLRALPDDAVVPVFVETSWARLPRTLAPGLTAAPIYPWGSAYAVVDVREAPPDARLRIWLFGEVGTEWSLVAVRLDAAGNERGRTRAPPTRDARGYIPLELGRGTASVVIVVTNLPDDSDPRDTAAGASRDLGIAPRLARSGLDPDALGPGPHGFRLTVDRGE